MRTWRCVAPAAAALMLLGGEWAAAEDGEKPLSRDFPYWRGAREESPGPFPCAKPAATNVTVVCDRWPDGSDLRQFGLDAARLSGAKTDHERAIAVWRWVRRWKIHTDGNAPTEMFKNPLQSKKRGYIDDPVKVLNVYGTHWCDGLSRAVEAVWRAMGHPAEKLVLGSHTMADCFYTDSDGIGRWHLFDVNYGSYIPHRSGERVLGPDGFATDYCKDFSQWKHCQHLAWPTHRMELAFRPGEKLERIWGNWGKPYQDNVDLERDPRRMKNWERGPYQVTYGNGRWTYSPDVRRQGVRNPYEKVPDTFNWHDALAEPPVNMASAGIQPARAGRPATAVWHFRTPYIVSDAEVELTIDRKSVGDAIRLHLSVDGGETWRPLWTCPDEVVGRRTLTVPICETFKVTGKAGPPEGFNSPFGRYHYRLRLELAARNRPEDCRVEAITFRTTVQLNLFSLPQLHPGRNNITVKADLARGSALKVTYVWDDAKAKARTNVTVVEKTPCTYEIIAAGKRWEDVVCKSITVEAVPATGDGTRTVVKEEPSEVHILPPMRPSLDTRTRGGFWKRRDTKDLPPVEDLVRQLDDPDAKVVTETLRGLLELADPKAFEAVRKVAFTRTEAYVKECALATLYATDRERARPVLYEIAGGSAEVKWAGYKTWKRPVSAEQHWASCALMIGTMAREAGWPEFVPVVARVAEAPGARAGHHLGAMRLLSQFGDARAVDAVRKGLASKDLNVRAYAALAAGRTGDRSFIPPLRQCLGSGYVVLRFRAATALGQLGDLESAPKIRAMLSHIGDENVRAAAAQALGDMGDTASTAALAAALQAEPVPWVKQVMTDALRKAKRG